MIEVMANRTILVGRVLVTKAAVVLISQALDRHILVVGAVDAINLIVEQALVRELLVTEAVNATVLVGQDLLAEEVVNLVGRALVRGLLVIGAVAVVLIRKALVRHLLVAKRTILAGLAILWGLRIPSKADMIGSKGARAVTVCLFFSHRAILLLAIASNLLTHKFQLRRFQPESLIPLDLGGMRFWIASRKVAVHFRTAEVPGTSFMLHDNIW
jgi:hypothetical protein